MTRASLSIFTNYSLLTEVNMNTATEKRDICHSLIEVFAADVVHGYRSLYVREKPWLLKSTYNVEG